MASPMTLRLDAETRRRIARIARRRRVSASQVVRDAIGAWVGADESRAAPFEALADLIGVVHGGDPARSTATGRRFASLLRARRGRR